MKPHNSCVVAARLMLVMVLATFASLAQEANDVESLGPAVDTSAPVDTTVVDDSAAPQPAVPAGALAEDVSRQESGGQVMDRIELGRTEITGNSELPTVLYIVPWQKSDPGDLMGRPVNTLLDEVLAPIDREEFIRQVDYYGDLYGEDEQK